MKKKPLTPFPTTAYYGPDYFCDRADELNNLQMSIKGGQSSTLIALRRIGKTTLIKHLFHHLGSKYILIYVDLLPTESINGLLSRLCTAIAGEHSENTRFGRKIWNMIKSLRPLVTYDSMTGSPQITIKVMPDESRKTITDLLSVLEAEGRPVVIAIDEFQQILEYPEKQTDAWLRSIIQKLTNVSFIFSGSQQHLMSDMFSNPAKPFYRSTRLIKIGKLNERIYRDFIIERFRDHSKDIPKSLVENILAWTEVHTYYVQLICNRLFLSSGKKITEELWKEEASKLLKEQEFVFFGYRDMLTKAQWNLLKAIALDIAVYHPTSSDFIAKHGLGSSATVLRSLNSLMKMELVYKENDSEGKFFYGIYDILFKRWISNEYNI